MVVSPATRLSPPSVPSANGSLKRAAEGMDLVVSLTAGAEAWGDEGERSDPLAFAELLVIGMAVSWPFVLVGSGVTPLTTRSVVLLVVMVLTVAVFAVPLLSVTVRRHFRRLSSTSSAATSSAVRLACTVVAVVSGAALVPTAALVGTWPLGVAIGLDLTRAARTLGVTLQPRVFVLRVARSPVHLGVLAGVILVVGLGPLDVDRVRVLALYLTGLALTGIGALTVATANAEARRWGTRLERHRQQVLTAAARHRGHWLHDDVCSEIRLTRLRLESGALGHDDVAVELDELDHRLRLRQLDEFIDAGSVRVAEVVQPFLRRVAHHGVVIVESPSVDTAGEVIPGDAARLLRRFLAVTVGNALQAGASSIAVRVGWEGDDLVVEVEDDAGGMPEGAVQPGTGLDALALDLGAANLQLEDGELGLVAQARLAGASGDRTSAGSGR